MENPPGGALFESAAVLTPIKVERRAGIWLLLLSLCGIAVGRQTVLEALRCETPPVSPPCRRSDGLRLQVEFKRHLHHFFVCYNHRTL